MKIQLAWIAQGGSGVGLPAPVVAKRRSRERVAWSTAAVLGAIAIAAATLAIAHLREAPPLAERVELTIPPPDDAVGISGAFAVSPDGRHVVFSHKSNHSRAAFVDSFAGVTDRSTAPR